MQDKYKIKSIEDSEVEVVDKNINSNNDEYNELYYHHIIHYMKSHILMLNQIIMRITKVKEVMN